MSEITPEIIAEHGLAPEEYERVKDIMGREPNLVELGIFSVMWSEHCSYKSSKKWLKTLPISGQHVIQGPGENAGVIDLGEGQAAIFKIESHNHPSFIEPYEGAATGVGGILRDVFTMGARPIMNLNALRFGDPEHPKTRHLLAGVVAGIGGYGNCVGIPTVGGEINFHPAYNGNILVNAMTVGLAPRDRIFYSAAAGAGNPVVYVGSKTGRDGIHGATMASAEFGADSEEKRPTVQVGDPFTEKLLIEACLELMETEAIVAIQDMGAAGLTSSSFEMASKGGVGVTLDLDRVPMREEGMTPYELMLSESQERMLMVLKPGHEDEARRIFEKWDLDFAVIGHLTDSGRMELRWFGETVGDLPIDPLAEAAPEYDRPHQPTCAPQPLDTNTIPETQNPFQDLKKLMSTADLCSRRWVWEQYDHLINGDTICRPGGDAAVVRLPDGRRGLAATTDCTPRYCLADPFEGGKQAVAESWRNLCAVGAHPMAVTNNLNFGNPERPEIMGQIVGCIQGLGEACSVLEYPVVSGNVSLYNETDGQPILPTPVIGGVGLVDDLSELPSTGFPASDLDIILVGETHGHLGQSLYLRELHGREEGPAPHVDLEVEKQNGLFMLQQIEAGRIAACHDISDGGLLVTLAEMALAGNLGLSLEITGTQISASWLFAEDQARYVVVSSDKEAVLEAAEKAGVKAEVIGRTGGDSLKLSSDQHISLDELREGHEKWFDRYIAENPADSVA